MFRILVAKRFHREWFHAIRRDGIAWLHRTSRWNRLATPWWRRMVTAGNLYAAWTSHLLCGVAVEGTGEFGEQVYEQEGDQ